MLQRYKHDRNRINSRTALSLFKNTTRTHLGISCVLCCQSHGRVTCTMQLQLGPTPAPSPAALPGEFHDDSIDLSCFGWGAGLQPKSNDTKSAAAHAPSSHYKYGKLTCVVVEGRLQMLEDVDLLSGFRVTGKILPFFTEIKVQGDSSWLAACTVYLANPNSAHGRRVLVVAVNADSAKAGAFPPTSFTHARLLSSKVSLSASAMAAVVAVEKTIALQAQTTRTAPATTSAATTVTAAASGKRSPRRLRDAQPKPGDGQRGKKMSKHASKHNSSPASKHSHLHKHTPPKPAAPSSSNRERKQIKSLSDQLNLLQAEMQEMKQHAAPSVSSAAVLSVASQAPVLCSLPRSFCFCVLMRVSV